MEAALPVSADRGVQRAPAGAQTSGGTTAREAARAPNGPPFHLRRRIAPGHPKTPIHKVQRGIHDYDHHGLPQRRSKKYPMDPARRTGTPRPGQHAQLAATTTQRGRAGPSATERRPRRTTTPTVPVGRDLGIYPARIRTNPHRRATPPTQPGDTTRCRPPCGSGRRTTIRRPTTMSVGSRARRVRAQTQVGRARHLGVSRVRQGQEGTLRCLDA